MSNQTILPEMLWKPRSEVLHAIRPPGTPRGGPYPAVGGDVYAAAVRTLNRVGTAVDSAVLAVLTDE